MDHPCHQASEAAIHQTLPSPHKASHKVRLLLFFAVAIHSQHIPPVAAHKSPPFSIIPQNIFWASKISKWIKDLLSVAPVMRSLIRVLNHVKPNHVDFLTKYMVQLPLWLPLTRIEEAMHQVLPGSFQPAQQIKTLNSFTHRDLIVFLITPLYWLCHNSKKLLYLKFDTLTSSTECAFTGCIFVAAEKFGSFCTICSSEVPKKWTHHEGMHFINSHDWLCCTKKTCNLVLCTTKTQPQPHFQSHLLLQLSFKLHRRRQ